MNTEPLGLSPEEEAIRNQEIEHLVEVAQQIADESGTVGALCAALKARENHLTSAKIPFFEEAMPRLIAVLMLRRFVEALAVNHRAAPLSDGEVDFLPIIRRSVMEVIPFYRERRWFLAGNALHLLAEDEPVSKCGAQRFVDVRTSIETPASIVVYDLVCAECLQSIERGAATLPEVLMMELCAIDSDEVVHAIRRSTQVCEHAADGELRLGVFAELVRSSCFLEFDRPRIANPKLCSECRPGQGRRAVVDPYASRALGELVIWTLEGRPS